jgi:exopolyphosphatase/guanosine-5'-triphosphate,3'-diphosphate pyrophosphatase
MEKQKIAVIDLGTNTFHLLITKYDSSYDYQQVHRERRAVMIGKGGINEGIISESAQLRALEALTHFKEVIERYDVSHVVATATSAFRNAKNGKSLAERILKQTGIAIDIISGEREADYIYYGVRAAVPLAGTSMIMDIGGGSVEFIICTSDDILWKESFEIGAQRLLDRFEIEDPISKENIQELLLYFHSKLETLTHAIHRYKPTTLIGASGTFDTLSDIYVIHENLGVAPNASELPLSYVFFSQTLQELSLKNREERLEIPGMAEMRVDMIVVACWLIQYVLDTYEIRNIRVSAFALKEGLLRSVTEQLIANQ